MESSGEEDIVRKGQISKDDRLRIVRAEPIASPEVLNGTSRESTI
jgi:hypothetical protein